MTNSRLNSHSLPHLLLKRSLKYSNFRSSLLLKPRIIFALFTSLFISSGALALEDKVFCVWDPVGRTGPVMTFYSDVIPKAQAWGLNLRFKAYTEETDVVEQFKAGKCEAAVLTSILSRQFVKFAGTMDAIGAINSKEGLELAIATLSRDRAGKLMIEDDYEVVTTFPVGSMYAFVKDRKIDTIDEFAGKKLAILNNDPQMYKFASLSNSIPVPVTLSNFADKFKTGEVDIVIMPALAYNTFELYEGLADKGGIVDYRLYYGMLQTIARRDQFPDDFGNKMRNYMLTRMKPMNKMVTDAEEEIPKKYWIKTNQFVKDEIDHFSKRIRLALQDSNVNNPTALKLFWKIRCRLDPSRGECKTPPSVVSQRQMSVEKPKEANTSASDKAAKLAAEEEKRKVQAAEDAKRKAAAEAKRIAELQRIEEEQLKQKLAAEKAEEAKKLELERQRLAALKAEQERLEQERIKHEQLIAEEKRRIEAEKLKLAQEQLALQEAKDQLQEEKEETKSSSWSLWDFLFGWI